MGRPKKAEPTDQVRVPQSMARRLRRIAAHEGVDAGDLLAELVAGPLNDREAKMLDAINRERQGEPKRKK